jgi:hypothetical protein
MCLPPTSSASRVVKARKPFWGLLYRRQCLLPTARGLLLFSIALVALAAMGLLNVHPFLAASAPVDGEVLVVEGWAPDYALEQAIAEFRRHHYRKMYVTGGPLQQGAPLTGYKTYAHLGGAILIQIGMDIDAVQIVPAPFVRQDRTYASAVALRDWFLEHGAMPAKLDLMSVGVHSRRSRYLLQQALGDGVRVGIISTENRDYDEKRWWQASEGLRAVISEFLAYCYTRCMFHPAH